MPRWKKILHVIHWINLTIMTFLFLWLLARWSGMEEAVLSIFRASREY